ncbi:helix-turn-helix domain-containing protein [Bdellovibrio sp. 22V]|uniref:winged helix-turn-helix transcriptional regulator n=1 Tax=Bdellovibrio sp. 22V TaxID=3044166 RepID=UPI002543A19F|nr:helix-turn-helix domain-containing protein [Bdellovibrio sp. 22V]WII73389.1 helix-turn-helix domain-containing protein [Bdellovibrio sp. 22V]
MVPRRKSKVQPPRPACPLTTCMSFIGGAWTPNIIWYLREGPRRFSELKNDIGKVSAKVLTTRLKKMEADGVLLRNEVPTSPPTVEYSLTPLGARLISAIESIVEVGHELKSRRK